MKFSVERFRSLFFKLQLAHECFFKPPKVWAPPPRSAILFFDAVGLELFTPYLQGYSVTVLHTRGESINLFVVFRSIFSRDFFTGKLLTAYFKAYTKLSRPKLVITFIDNSPYFHLLSTTCSVATMFIQNGIRTKNDDVFSCNDKLSKQKNRVDYMLVFGEYTGEEYKKIISGKVISIGSFKNNCFSPVRGDRQDTVVFISQWKVRPDDGSFFRGAGGTVISHEKFYSAERFILPIVLDWCKTRGKSLSVIGGNVRNSAGEKDFFDSILPLGSFVFVPARPFPFSYEFTNSAELVVFIDSALGYESLSRGNRAACFSCRGIDVANSDRGFGCPGALPESGPFWTNNRIQSEVISVLDNVCSVGNEEWSMQLSLYMPKIMRCDNDNTKFSELLSAALGKPAQIVTEPTLVPIDS